MGSTQDRDDGSGPGSRTGLEIAGGVAHHRDRPRVVDPEPGHGTQDHVRRRSPPSDVGRGQGEVDLALSPADVGRGRPEPDMILGAMSRLGVGNPRAVAVVGDTVSDLEAGARAGAGAVVGVLSGAHDEATLSAAPHTAIIADVTGLLPLLESS